MGAAYRAPIADPIENIPPSALPPPRGLSAAPNAIYPLMTYSAHPAPYSPLAVVHAASTETSGAVRSGITPFGRLLYDAPRRRADDVHVGDLAGCDRRDDRYCAEGCSGSGKLKSTTAYYPGLHRVALAFGGPAPGGVRALR